MGLLDEITKLTTPASELPDLEDELDASSLVKPTGNRSKQPQNFNFEEGKYAGAAVSRAQIFGDVSQISGLKAREESEESDDDDEDVDDEDEIVEESDWEREPEAEAIPKQSKSKILEAMETDDDDMEDEEDEGDSGEDDDDDDDEVDDEEEEEEEEEESNLGMTTLSLKDDSDKADKATSVLHQRQVWDDLTYSNIRIHALLNAMNQMPRGETRKNLLKTCDSTTQKSLESAMENMAKLRDLMKTAAGFFDEEKSGKGAAEDSDDEEIPSDEEILSESEGEEDVEDSEDEETPKKKQEAGTSLKSLKKNLDTLDSSMEKFRAATITKWYNRTKVLNAKSMNNTDFSVFEKGSILGQINKVLADEDKLLKKVHTNRSGKPRIGAPTTPDTTTTDSEIFDDSDFYQLLLKQMLEARNQMSQSTQDGADMTRSYMELQSMIGSKKKRDVSQMSSKDRKLKYEPIAKLINFYPSKPSVATWTHESRNELFKSLFS